MIDDKKKYYSFKYDNKERFISYWHQIDEILSCNPELVVEIGVGNKFVTNYLRQKGINVLSIDINYNLNPDIVANVLSLPLPDNFSDVVCCFQVLEHLPFRLFPYAISEIARVTNNYVILSLPHLRNYTYYKLPCLGIIVVPSFKHRWRELPEEHKWEIGKPPSTIKNIIKICETKGLKLVKQYHIPEHPYHHIFKFRK